MRRKLKMMVLFALSSILILTGTHADSKIQRIDLGVGKTKEGAQVITVGAQSPQTLRASVKLGQPNIVFILLDDLDETTMPYWEALKMTKKLLQSNGITFKNAFAPTPECCPARASILTGKYGHNTRVLNNLGTYGGWEAFVNPKDENGNPTGENNEEHTVAKYLYDAGYKTALIGKYLNGIDKDPHHIPPGWSEWYAGANKPNIFYWGYNYTLNENGILVDYGSSAEDYLTDVIARKAVDFIKRAKDNDDQPFFLYVAPTAPHAPILPARRHSKHAFRDWEVPKPPNYNEADISDKPFWLRSSGDIRSKWMQGNDKDFRNRMGSLYAVDEMIVAIAKALKDNQELMNTIIVFTSDNGYNLGAHRLIHKMVPYEESLRVPLVIAGPWIPKGTIEERMVLQIDFAPTFLDLAGLPIPDDMDGLSLVPLLQRDPNQVGPNPWRRDFIAQYTYAPPFNWKVPPAFWYLLRPREIPSYRALRTEDYTYIEWDYKDLKDNDIHELELYDLRRDPYQLENLLSTPTGELEYSNLLQKLQGRLKALAKCSGKSCRD